MSLCFFGQGYISRVGGSQFLQNFEGFADKGGGEWGEGLTGLEFFFLRGGGKIKRADVNISGWG